MKVFNYILQDWDVNRCNPTKGRYVVVLFRISQLIRSSKISFVVLFWFLLFYRVVVEWLMCIELSWNTSIGPGLQIYHGSGLVIHPNVTIGSNCKVRQCTTIGVRQNEAGIFGEYAPQIGSNVDIGCNSVLLGDIVIGDDVTIGAGSVVLKDVFQSCTVVGNPARVIQGA